MLNSAVVSAWLWIHVGILLIAIAYATVGRALLPMRTERARAALAARPLRVFGIGLGVTVPWAGIAIALMVAGQGGPVGLLGVVIGLAWLLAALAGLATLATHVGSAGTSGDAPWWATTRGAACVALTWMLPVVGWFILLPATLALSLGCLLVGRRTDG